MQLMKKLKNLLKKINKFFGWIIGIICLVSLIIMKVLSKNSDEIDQQIKTKKKDIQEKKDQLKKTEAKLNKTEKELDTTLEKSKKLNDKISTDKKIRDKQADKFFHKE